jgi:hypothetical protein
MQNPKIKILLFVECDFVKKYIWNKCGAAVAQSIRALARAGLSRSVSSNPGRIKNFLSSPRGTDRLWDPPILYLMCKGTLFAESKAVGA